ncbi:right-handed parallel beta-helix repeat-containing protein [Candidatus Shapirobacteria bacterium]|nr:right-handed parallel beta-helix repeat-containing protein [Candidatus Shapirobacteria bacterium]
MALSFDFYNSVITVLSPDTSVTIQQLINGIRDTEDELVPAMSYGHIADAYGKQDLGGGVQVGITLVLQSPWRVAFEARSGPETVSCRIDGGNLVGGLDNNPIAPTAFTQVTMANSSSATLATPNDTANLKYLIESMANSHMGVGSTYYWDPTNGNDSNNGVQPSTAVKTFARLDQLLVDNHYDTVYCISADPSGLTTVTETLAITKSTVKLRGPGYSFQLKPTGTSADTISISGHSVQISGLYIETAVTGNRKGVSISGNNNQIRDCWIKNCRSDGINIATSTMSKVNNCVIENCGGSGTGNGVSIGSSTIQLSMVKNVILGNVNGVAMAGTGVLDNLLENNLIYNNSGLGLQIGAGVVRTTVRSGNTIINNSGGNTQDLGTDSYIETPAGGASASEIADAVWDELLASHTVSNSAGKTLKDAKSKATLASLK